MLIPLHVKFCAACYLRYLKIGGALRPDLDHRGTSLAKSVPKRKQTPSNKSHSPTLASFMCTVEKYALICQKYTFL